MNRRTLILGSAAALAASAIPASAAPRGVLLVAGQSLAVQWVGGAAEKAFLASKAVQGEEWTVQGAAVGGTMAAKQNRGPTNVDRWWYDPLENRWGPALLHAARVIQSMPRPATHILWNQGQNDAWAVDHFGHQAAVYYRAATERIFAVLRRKIRPADPLSVPIWFEPLGRREPEREADRVIRAVQHEIIAETENVYALPVLLDLPLKDRLHPTPEGDAIRGWIAAQHIAL